VDKISILITTYNRDEFLEEALRSVLAQTFTNWEGIVVDNGWSTSTQDIVTQYRDERLIYVKAKHNLGECGGRNLAFAHATGDYICYLDDDDLLPKDSLEQRLAFYNDYPLCGMIYGEYARFWMDLGQWRNVNDDTTMPSRCSKNYYDSLLADANYKQEEILRLLRVFNFVRGGTPLIKRSTLDAVGLFDERFLDHGDYEMWLRIASRYPIRFLDRVVYYYRLHAGSIQIQMSENEEEKQYALILCRKHKIRYNIQFSRYQRDIDTLW
jgi:glycosyltransferase involved in cell wall biosynthesis